MSVTGPGSFVSDRLPRLWAAWAASRPSQLALILLIYLLGVGLATVGPPFVSDGREATSAVSTSNLDGLALGAIALVLVSATVYYANEYADADTDALTDRTPFSGGGGALIVTGLPRSFLRRLMVGAGALSGLALAGIAVTGALPHVAVGLLVFILLAGLAYSLPPFSLIRRGFGEVVNVALGGTLVPLYGVSVVSTPTLFAALATIPFALVVGCNLLALHWPDREADATVGKQTLVVRWSPPRIRRAYFVLVVTSVAIAGVLWWGGIFPDAVAMAHLIPVPFLVWGWATLTRRRSPFPSVTAMVVLAVASTVAWWWVGIG